MGRKLKEILRITDYTFDEEIDFDRAYIELHGGSEEDDEETKEKIKEEILKNIEEVKKEMEKTQKKWIEKYGEWEVIEHTEEVGSNNWVFWQMFVIRNPKTGEKKELTWGIDWEKWRYNICGGYYYFLDNEEDLSE